MSFTCKIFVIIALSGLIGCSPKRLNRRSGAKSGLDASTNDAQPNRPTDLNLACGSEALTNARVWRLTRAQYNNAIHDVFGIDVNPANEFVAEERVNGFTNQAHVLQVAPLAADQFQIVAEELAEQIVQSGKLFDCDISQDQCIDQLISRVGLSLFRGPVSSEQKQGLMQLYALGKQTSPQRGVELVLSAMLQSPYFLYRSEIGVEANDQNLRTLTAYEVAEALSFLLWNSVPDQALLAAASKGSLYSKQGIMQQVDRMLKDEKAKRMMTQFFYQFLDLEKMKRVSKDDAKYEQFDDQLREDMLTETMLFIENIIWKQQGGLKALLSSSETFINESLADIYDHAGMNGSHFQKVTLDQTQRSGILTHASLMSILAKPEASSTVRRGKFVREKFLCQILPAPPPGADAQTPDLGSDATEHEIFSAIMKNPSCGGCHKLMDPIGFGFENYDAIGAFRTAYHGKPVSPAGELIDAGSSSKKFSGIHELANILEASPEVQDCMSLQVFRYAMGRSDEAKDQCSVNQLKQKFKSSGGSFSQLFRALVEDDAFRARRNDE